MSWTVNVSWNVSWNVKVSWNVSWNVKVSWNDWACKFFACSFRIHISANVTKCFFCSIVFASSFYKWFRFSVICCSFVCLFANFIFKFGFLSNGPKNYTGTLMSIFVKDFVLWFLCQRLPCQVFILILKCPLSFGFLKDGSCVCQVPVVYSQIVSYQIMFCLVVVFLTT